MIIIYIFRAHRLEGGLKIDFIYQPQANGINGFG